jgi:isoquinoline 1-oxidoreductase subunit beta
MNNLQNVSRRGFLRGAFVAGTFVLGARLVPEPLWAEAPSAGPAVFQPDIFLGIASDGTVTIVAHRSEMGCGSRTALPLIVADELDADWSKVKIDQAIGDPKYSEQDTDGSHSVRSFTET